MTPYLKTKILRPEGLSDIKNNDLPLNKDGIRCKRYSDLLKFD